MQNIAEQRRKKAEYMRRWNKTEKGKAAYQRTYSKKLASSKRWKANNRAHLHEYAMIKRHGPDWRLIFERDNGRCVICDSPNGIHIHHRLPPRLGGDNSIDNQELRCCSCHRRLTALARWAKVRSPKTHYGELLGEH